MILGTATNPIAHVVRRVYYSAAAHPRHRAHPNPPVTAPAPSTGAPQTVSPQEPPKVWGRINFTVSGIPTHTCISYTYVSYTAGKMF